MNAEVAVVDTHCHLSHCEAGADAALALARDAGLRFVVDIGMGLTESADCAARAAQTGFSRASVGLHPTSLAEFRDDPNGSVAALEKLLTQPGVVAVGETGLDFYWDSETPETQREAFCAQIELAKRHSKALVVHCRDAFDPLVEILMLEGAPHNTVMHCFSGDAEDALLCVEQGWYCSFAGNVTYKRNGHLHDAATRIPSERLLVETDAPYMSPVPHRGKKNTPAWVVHTLEFIAGLRGVTPAELGRVTTANAESVFSA